MKYVIFDLDGCLADDRHRLSLIDHKAQDPWEAYHTECHKDPLINGHLLCKADHCDVIIFTGRPEKHLDKTERWLREVAGLKVSQIFMRPDGCVKSNAELKVDFLNSLFSSGITPRDIVCAFDDRDDVQVMYELYGITAQKVGYPSEENSNARKI